MIVSPLNKRILRYLRPYRRHFFVALACMVVFGASDGVIPYIVKHILDGIFAEKNISLLYFLPALIVIFSLIRAAADFGQQFFMARIGHWVVRDMRNEVNATLLRLSSGFFLRNATANLLSRVTSDVLLVRTLLTDSVASVIRDLVRIVALLITAITLDPFLALLAFVVFPVAIVPVYRFGKKMRRLARQGQDAIGKISIRMQESIVGQKVVRIFGREAFEQERFEEENGTLTETFVRSERVKALTGPVNEVLASFAIGSIILYGGHSVIGGARTQGDFVAFLIALFLLYEPFKKLSRVHNNVQQGIAGAERIFEVLDAQPEVLSPENPREMSSSADIAFHGVSFRYAQNKPYALQGISHEIPEGKRHALVGFSGAGKSTLVDLIPRFLDPSEGSVTVGGVDLKDLDLHELRAQIAMVSQHTFLFNDSVFHNIAYGRSGATRDEVVAAAQSAYAHNFIEALPEGYDTVLGEGGLSLSGGERQRIAIARALLKDAPILILDEATASLDNRAEREVQAALDRLASGRTSVVIAHRLSTVREADCIIVLREGKIVEQGTHDELLANGGEYATLYEMQFSAQEGHKGTDTTGARKVCGSTIS